MRRLAILCTALGLPLAASAAQAQSLPQRYSHDYYGVAHHHGKRAPGRNIRRDGVLTKHGARPATSADLRRSAQQLERILHPARVVRYLAPTAPAQAPAGVATMRAGGTLAAIRQCESGGNYSTNTGNGFYGAYQFTQSTWASVGGSGNPAQAPPAEQDRRAAILYARSGSGQWPVCGR